jgi:hypothetical protein
MYRENIPTPILVVWDLVRAALVIPAYLFILYLVFSLICLAVILLLGPDKCPGAYQFEKNGRCVEYDN